jgi:succinyl-CoA synthetase alpha subunit
MRLTVDMEAVPGVARAAAMMGTPQNLALLRHAGLLAREGEAATPTDLVIAVSAGDEAAARVAWDAAERALGQRSVRGGGPGVRHALDRGAGSAPRTLRSAIEMLPDANLALISVPGPYAAAEAAKALHAGLHVMLFSDNVSVADEVRVKRLARERGRFALGPDCGTAILDGVPLGFANAVPRGRIGLAAASGTGLQAVTCHLAALGEGVSHAIGLGGRDLSDEVGGLMLEPALDALAADPATTVIVVIGKPPGPVTAKKITGWLERLAKPWVTHFTGDEASSTASTLEDAAGAAVALARGERPRPVEFTLPGAEIARLVARATHASGRRCVRGVYAGGTLAQEAAALLSARLGGVAWGAGDAGRGVAGDTGHGGIGGAGHRVVDLGDDVYTVGRPHPMIDGTLRREWIAREATDPTTAVILLDVVLGYGAHPDPAGELRAAIEAACTHGVTVVASVCGTDRDPQGLARQTATLQAAGALVMPSNAQAARLAARVAGRAGGER